MFLLDTGARRAELVGLRLADLDLDLDVAVVLGKGRRERALPFGRKTAVALDRYLRVRARHRDAGLPWLWLGQRGLLGPYGVRQILRRRGAEAGLPDLHAHQLRHTFAHALARPGRRRNRPDAAGRLEVPPDAWPVRRLGRRRPRPRAHRRLSPGDRL